MKNAEKNQLNENRGRRKSRLKKWLSGFLAVLTAVTMLSGQTALFYGDEPDSTYALAGEGSGQDVTIHFGNGADEDIHIHVNPETGAEENAALAGLGAEEVDDVETEAETEAGTEGAETGEEPITEAKSRTSTSSTTPETEAGTPDAATAEHRSGVNTQR